MSLRKIRLNAIRVHCEGEEGCSDSMGTAKISCNLMLEGVASTQQNVRFYHVWRNMRKEILWTTNTLITVRTLAVEKEPFLASTQR